jgi:hypothetical protein
VTAKKSGALREPQRDKPLPRLPHPSWRQAVAGSAAKQRPLSADDFWTRLGL